MPRPPRQNVSPTTAEESTKLQLAQISARRSMDFWDRAFGFGRTLARCATVSVCAYTIYLSVDAIAGEKTLFVAMFDVVAKMELDEWVFRIASLVAAGGWWMERRARKKYVRERDPYVRQLERLLDPDRSSSGLREDGSPSKDDLDGA